VALSGDSAQVPGSTKRDIEDPMSNQGGNNQGGGGQGGGGQGGGGPGNGNNTVTIVVDGTPHEVNKGTVTYAEIVTLAYADYPQHAEITYSVTYKKGPTPNPEGILSAGGHVVVKNGMVFNVSRTGQS
jgi:hypothetical protein